VNDRRGGQLAVEHLLARGHRRIAFVGGPSSLAQVRERKAGAEVQDELRAVLRTLAAQAPAGVQLSEEVRAELRLLSRTIAAALDGRRERPAIDR
jgi:LacI family transcriptional regulator